MFRRCSPAAGRRKKGRGGDSDDEGPRQQQGGQGKGASEGGVGKRGGRKSKGARRREKEEAAERDLRQQVLYLLIVTMSAPCVGPTDGVLTPTYLGPTNDLSLKNRAVSHPLAPRH